ncbi:hypothetical protein CPB83DRAFT_68707 [Crepidotus variabilis]|uniref:Nephrocystin 3-like N-terminal domain-containing protein n=1 Tax=Crepidotus variabilis TaxID=179855 RepID=A0A9P6JJM2_9AGAR|nr:hypothetical protein CPB83DRAFT_68707 [Crepidotus variabilis]
MTRQPLCSFFYKVRNVSVTDSTVSCTIYYNESRNSGIHLLSQSISTSAMHDSSTRDPPPRCHPTTRKASLDTIITFVEDPDPQDAVLWMNAPFGHGKSAVMQTVIETLRTSSRGHLVAGSFFFGREKEGRDKAHYLLPAILYQIAHNIPGMYEHINDAINADPTLPSKSIETQFIPLLVAPFRNFTPTLTQTPTVFIDGLDECYTSAAQRSVLKLIAEAISIHKVPLRFVIASRPEVHIEQSFNALALSSISRSFELDDDFENMVTYFRAEFDNIYDSRAESMVDIPKPWPSNKILWDLARRASGQYLFASTVIRFVDDEYDNPVEQLQVLLGPHPRQSSAFSTIDTLYTQILSVYPNRLRDSLLRILGMIIHREDGRVTVASLSDLLNLAPLEVWTILRSIRAVVKIKELPAIPPHDTNFSLSNYLSPTVIIRHISLKEFLINQDRARDFWVDMNLMEAILCRRSDFLLASSISGSVSTNIVHPATWICVRCPIWSPETGTFDVSSWPLFIQEFSKYKMARLHSQALDCKPQSLKTFCWILGCWKNWRSFEHSTSLNEDFETVKTIVTIALRERFKPLSQAVLDLFALLSYFDYTEKAMFATTLGAIKKRPDLSFSASLRALDSASVFLSLDKGNSGGFNRHKEPTMSDMRVGVNWSIMDILLDSELVGTRLYTAHREARIIALSRCYKDFLLREIPGSKSFQANAQFLFRLPMIRPDIMTLKNIDNSAGSRMGLLIDQICSSRSLAVVCDIAAFGYSTPRFFTPLFIFASVNCLEAKSLGTRFGAIREKLKCLVTRLLQISVLAAVFNHSDYHDPSIHANKLRIYHNLIMLEALDLIRWLDLVDEKTHDAILTYLIDIDTLHM